jgi:hypothetical protein
MGATGSDFLERYIEGYARAVGAASPSGTWDPHEAESRIAVEKGTIARLTDWRSYLVPLLLLLAFVMLSSAAAVGIAIDADFPAEWRAVATSFSAALAAFCVGATLKATHIRLTAIASSRARIQELEAGKSDENLAERRKPGYFEQLVEINVVNLSAYYTLVKRQTDRSYTASLTVAILSFVLVAAGLIAGSLGTSSSAPTVSFVSVGAGILGEFVASVFFYLYSKTVRQLKDYHESLVRFQNVLLALKMTSDIQTDETRADLTVVVVKALLEQHHAPPTPAA